MLPAISTRTAQTTLVYIREGRRHRRRAARLYQTVTCPIEALAKSFEADTSPLRPRTIRRYRQEVAASLDEMVEEDPNREAAATVARTRIEASLKRRRGRPPIPRASTKKVRDPSATECACVLADLRRRAAAPDATGLAELVPDFVMVAPRLGLRPVEWLGAQISGAVLTVRCAKATNGRSCGSHRPIGLAALGADFIAAVERVVARMPEMLASYTSWDRLRDAMAERLARACTRAGTRRLSLYSFRHCAIATWKAAGLSAAEIAALAGHKTEMMQKSYAGARHGWEADTGLPQPDPALVKAIAARSATGSAASAILSSPFQPENAAPSEGVPFDPHLPVQLSGMGRHQTVGPETAQAQDGSAAVRSTQKDKDFGGSADNPDFVTWSVYKARQAVSIQRMLSGLGCIPVSIKYQPSAGTQHAPTADDLDAPSSPNPLVP